MWRKLDLEIFDLRYVKYRIPSLKYQTGKWILNFRKRSRNLRVINQMVNKARGINEMYQREE